MSVHPIVVAVKAVIIHDDRFLVIKRAADDEISPGTWELVGGKLDFGETLEHALEREIFEEVGLRVIVQQLLYATTFLTDPKRQVVIMTYSAHSVATTVTLSAEHTDARWVTADEARQLLHWPILDDLDSHDVWALLRSK
ncbi:NUDIX domain-containing protein [Exiguobacterium sp. AM39-5BH]|uniref:NUDIX hydrolase n=1 Tax=Exiguobacterium sp. AM39-5BH TaxID=2292355 RepID=UPI000FE1FDBB|nr:NUDIX domain-containing protein [Exiguobacterium sp. AM39-5BH]RHB50020.1 NUDIX domain-containing protein [Exiguobacterium sp. AM39-5BH]